MKQLRWDFQGIFYAQQEMETKAAIGRNSLGKKSRCSKRGLEMMDGGREGKAITIIGILEATAHNGKQ